VLCAYLIKYILLKNLVKNRIIGILFIVHVLLIHKNVQSQDLEPGFLSVMPMGGNFAIASYIYSAGNILLDNTLPIEDLNAKLNNSGIGYVRSFKMFNRLAKFDVVMPFSLGKYNALAEGEEISVTRNGFGDPSFRISLIIIGVKPLKPKEYFKEEPKNFKLGIVFRFKAPIGNYDSEKLLNTGTNRWTFRTGIAGSYTFRKKIVLEGHLNSWFFTENSEFFGENTSKQKALFGSQLHITYIFKPGVWAALSTGRTFGGNTVMNGIEQDVTQNNTRFGLAFGYRLNRNNGLKVAFTNGFITRGGADFTTFVLAYQFMWFDKK